MKPYDDTRSNVMILGALAVGILASNFDGPVSSLMMLVSFVVLVCLVLPGRLRMGASARRHEPGVQLLRYLASSGGQITRLQHDVIDSYVRGFGGDRMAVNRTRRAPRLADVDRILSRVAAAMDARETDALLDHIAMMRRTRSEHPPLAIETYERIRIRLEVFRDIAPEHRPDRISTALATLTGSFGRHLGIMAPSPVTPTRLVGPRTIADPTPAPTPTDPDPSAPVMEALSLCDDPRSIDLMRRLRPLLRPDGRGGLGDDLLREADAAVRDLSELAVDFLRSRSRTGTAALDADFVRIADGVAGRIEDLLRRQSGRDADGFSERARFIEQRHGLTPDDGLGAV